MSGLIDMFTGASADRARKMQEQALEEQNIQQTRQLQSQAADTAKTALVRRDPRGRRLLADASVAGLPETVG